MARGFLVAGTVRFVRRQMRLFPLNQIESREREEEQGATGPRGVALRRVGGAGRGLEAVATLLSPLPRPRLAPLAGFRGRLARVRTSLSTFRSRLATYLGDQVTYRSSLATFRSRLARNLSRLSTFRTRLASHLSRLASFRTRLATCRSRLDGDIDDRDWPLGQFGWTLGQPQQPLV